MDERAADQVPPFDERAVLDELERFRLEIRRYKSRRQAVDEEFERFTRSFRTPATEDARGTRPAVGQAEQPTPIVESASLSSPAAAPVPARSADRHARARTRAVLGGALVVLAGSALVTWTWIQRAPGSSTAPAPGDAPRASPSETPESPAPVRVTASPFESELATSRAVWVRVLADGERVVERELPANARVPLKAKQKIVIRAGDAGAVRLSIGGRDQGALGPDGEVVTRTFSVPSPERR